jgi:hypothetical protein
MQNIRLENMLLIDIETVSAVAEFNQLHEDWKHLWEEKVQRQLPEDVTAAEFYPQRAAVMAEFSKVVCISVGYFKKDGNAVRLRVKSFYCCRILLLPCKRWNPIIINGVLPDTTSKNLIFPLSAAAYSSIV